MFRLIAAAAAVSTLLGDPSAPFLNEGARHLEKGDVARGLEETEKAIDKSGVSRENIAVGYNNLCVAYLKLKLYDVALEYCEKAMRYDKSDWRIYNNRANAHLGLGNVTKAIDDYLSALDRRPRSRIVRENLLLALSYARLGTLPEPAPRRQL